MRQSRRAEWMRLGREALAALLALALVIQVAMAGEASARPAAPGFDPLSALCAYHPDGTPVSGQPEQPDRTARHDLCCMAWCGGLAVAHAMPAGGGILPSPRARALGGGWRLRAAVPPDLRFRLRAGARAPPVPA